MLNIIKSIRYSLHREMLTWVYATAILIAYVFMVILSLDNVDVYTGAYGFRAIVESNEIICFVVALLFVPLICSSDFSDKFINYELLGGYKKSHVYFARALYSYVFVYGYFMVSCGIPLIIGCIMNGYCSFDLQVNDLFLLLIVGLVMVLRGVSVVIFFSFLFENNIASVLVMYLLEVMSLMPSVLLGELFEGLDKTYFISTVATYEKVMLPSDMVPGFVNGRDVYLPVYNFSENIGAIVGSLVFGAVLLFVGYAIFSSRDRK